MNRDRRDKPGDDERKSSDARICASYSRSFSENSTMVLR